LSRSARPFSPAGEPSTGIPGSAQILQWRYSLSPPCLGDDSSVQIKVNRVDGTADADGDTPLLWVLRDILDGTPVFRGTRVPIRSLFDYLQGGETLDEVPAAIPAGAARAGCSTARSRMPIGLDRCVCFLTSSFRWTFPWSSAVMWSIRLSLAAGPGSTSRYHLGEKFLSLTIL
jgi:hypothetical protein